jgi:phage tail protein X
VSAVADFETVVTTEGDMVDLIAFKRFGDTAGITETIYEANPGLAEQGPVLPAGVVIRVPVPLVRERATPERIWD